MSTYSMPSKFNEVVRRRTSNFDNLDTQDLFAVSVNYILYLRSLLPNLMIEKNGDLR